MVRSKLFRLLFVGLSTTALSAGAIAASGPALADTHYLSSTAADPYAGFAFAGQDYSVSAGTPCPPVSGAGDWTADVYFGQQANPAVYLRSFVVADDGSWGGPVQIPDTAAVGPARLSAVCFDAAHHIASATDVYYTPLWIDIVPVHTFAVDRSAASPGTPVRVSSVDPCPAPTDAADWYYVVAVRDPQSGAYYGTPPTGAPDAAGTWAATVNMPPSGTAQIAAGCGDHDRSAGSTDFDLYVPTTITVLPPPTVALSTKSLSFGQLRLRTTSPARTVTLTNPSSGTLTFGQATVRGTNRSDFQILADTCSNRTLEPGGSCQASVTFRPSAGGTRSAALAFVDNAPGSPQLVALTGRGCSLLLGGLCV